MKGNKDYAIRKQILIPMIIVFIMIIVFGVSSPSKFFNAENAISTFGYQWFGWLYILVTISSIAILTWLFFSKHSKMIIGGETAKPMYKSKWQWFAVILCSIIGTGMVIWGVAEPITFFWDPVPGVGALDPGSQQAAVQGLGTSLLHWGIPSIALYVIMAVVIAFASYNMKLPFRVSSILYPIFGKKTVGAIGDVVDNFCFFSIAVSVAAVLAVASTTIGSGISIFFGLEPSTILQGIILLVILITFIISSYTGLLKGVRILSDINAKIFVFLIAFVFIFGGARFILSLSTEALGASVDMFFRRMTYLGTVDGDMWPMWWTVIYWVWMIVYGPMMGLFLAKVGRGRTLRQFIGFNMLPALFIMVWFCVFGSSAIHFDLNGGGIYETMSSGGLEAAIFAFFNNLPLSMILGIGFILVLYLSVVTMSDGLTTTVSSLSIDFKKGAIAEPPATLKIFWGIVMASVAFISIFANASSADGINMLNAAKMLPMVGALPMLFVYVGGIYAVVKMFNNREKYDVVYYPESAIVEKELIQDFDESEVE